MNKRHVSIFQLAQGGRRADVSVAAAVAVVLESAAEIDEAGLWCAGLMRQDRRGSHGGYGVDCSAGEGGSCAGHALSTSQPCQTHRGLEDA